MLNFNILKTHWLDLSEFGTQAVDYINSDPQTTAIKLRCFAERAVNVLYQCFNLPSDNNTVFFEKLIATGFKENINQNIINKLHLLRLYGNKAAHAESITIDDAQMLAKEAYTIALWMKNNFITKLQDSVEECSIDAKDSIKKIDLITFCESMSLTRDQSLLIEKLDEFFKNKFQNVFLLKGYAGTGKTYIIKILTEFLEFNGRYNILSAPTGKAARVISQKTGKKASTVHSLIYQIDKLEEYTSKDKTNDNTFKIYAHMRKNEYPSNTVFIIDEASMVPNIYQDNEFLLFGSGFILNDLFKFIGIDHNDHDKKVILIGDNAQLPPIGMDFSPALSSLYLKEKYGVSGDEYELREIVRQDIDSGIVQNALSLRNALETNTFNKLDIDISKPDVEHLDYGDLITKYINARNLAPDETIMIAHTNTDVAAYNKSIRNSLFPGVEHVTNDDILIIVQNCSIQGYLFANGDIVKVVSVNNSIEKKMIPFKDQKIELAFRNIVIEFKGSDGEKVRTDIKIFENLLYNNSASLTSEEQKALFIDFRIRFPNLKSDSKEFQDAIMSDPYFNALKVKFGYAITCHKAQGSEWDTVFLKCKTSFNAMSQNYFRWLYTAMTRSSKKLYLLDEPHIGILDGLKPVNTFNKVKHNDFSEALDAKIKLVDLSGIDISNIIHNQYEDVYVFTDNINTARISFYYNKDNHLTKVLAKECNELTKILLKKFEIFNDGVFLEEEAEKLTFPEPFLEELYVEVKAKIEKYNIVIIDIKHYQYMERYHFKKDNNVAVFDFYYTDKKRFNKMSSQPKCSSSELLSEIERIIRG